MKTVQQITDEANDAVMSVSTNFLEDVSIKSLHEAALDLKKQADAANDKLSKAMLEWLQEKLPDGTVIDLRHPKHRENKDRKPEYLMNVRVCSGNARGTHIFRIEHVRSVEVNVRHPDISAWYANATPISEINGDDMSGTAGNSKHSGKHLELKGSFGFDF